ncbi:MAG TPA: diaminopimelate epimerase [Terriglobales bacterium]|nr:diaminopimelate epimerase [Terriglobales bacterium]
MTALLSGVSFTKASACGNDFLIMDGMHAPAEIGDFSRRICDRHQGVGADGVEWLFPAQDADIHARLFNADGSEAEISGNGTRCVAAYLCSQEPRQTVVIRTGAGVKTCLLTSVNGTHYEFEIAMGEPQVDAEVSLQLTSGMVRGIPVSMGNPHYVIFVDEFAAEWRMEAAEIGRHPAFKYGVNVELVRIDNKSNIEVRIFERGVGETQSSGTGSCASAVAAIAAGRAESPVRVHTPGGIQIVRWVNDVFLRGPATLVARGEFFG